MLVLPRVEPLRPRLTKVVPKGREWLYELKLDGFRGMLYLERGEGKFFSKNERPMPRFRELASMLARELRGHEAILDGEIVVMTERGPNFNALFWNRGRAQYAAFDLLWLDGRDLRSLPLWRRKRELKKFLKKTSIGFVEDASDPRLYDSAVAMDLEGIVAKRRSDPYGPQTEWLKIKHAKYSQMVGRWELFRRR